MGAVPAGAAPARRRAPHGNGSGSAASLTSGLAAGTIKVGRFRRRKVRSFLRNRWKVASVGAGLVAEKRRVLLNSAFWQRSPGGADNSFQCWLWDSVVILAPP